jgi:hypothetical protein
MSTAHSAFLDYVLPHVPGCTNEMALQEIKNTIIDFCEKSLILQTDHDPVTAIVGQIDYDLEPPKDRLVVRVMKAWYKGQLLEEMAPDDIDTPSVYNQQSGYHVHRGDPLQFFQKEARTFSVYPIPNETVKQSITLRVALKPTRSATTIDDLIYEEYAETIGSGAISRLALSPGKPYSNAGLANAHRALFQAGLNVARDRSQNGYVRASRQVKMRRI